MLFTIIKVGLKGRSFYRDPKQFAQGAVMETALSSLIPSVIFAFLFLAFLFILSFTSLLGGPFLLAKILFWILVIGYAIFSIPIYLFYRVMKAASRKVGNTTERIFTKSEIKE